MWGSLLAAQTRSPPFCSLFFFFHHNWFPEFILQLWTMKAALRDGSCTPLNSSACLISYSKHPLEMIRSSTYQMESTSRQSSDCSNAHDPSVDAENVPMSLGQSSQHNERDRRSSYALDARTLAVWWWLLATLSTVNIFMVLAIFANNLSATGTPT